jgi:hypothetical protein
VNNPLAKSAVAAVREIDEVILLAVANPKFTIDGMRNKNIRLLLPNKTSAQISRLFKRLRQPLIPVETVAGDFLRLQKIPLCGRSLRSRPPRSRFFLSL